MGGGNDRVVDIRRGKSRMEEDKLGCSWVDAGLELLVFADPPSEVDLHVLWSTPS